MTSATRAMIGLAVENDASMDAAEKAALLARIDGGGVDEGGEPLLTVAEVARRLHKHPKTIHLYCRMGLLKKVTFGKQSRASGILKSSVDALLKGGAGKAVANG